MYTLMHISDLHRSGSNPTSNVDLLSSLLVDRQRFSTETPPICSPDAIIVSGDLVLGLPLGAAQYPEALRRQYDEAYDFLARLADSFVDGDRSRIVIVPGNHDVDWNMARRAMQCVDTSEHDIQKLLSMPNSPYRWSWKNLEPFRVVDQDVYENRFKYFWNLHKRFYNTAHLALPLDPQRTWNFFEFDNGRIMICAFSSCTNTDCFSFFGEIPSEAVSGSYLQLAAERKEPLLTISVWHHDVQGPPRRSDYMDVEIVRLMIDRGYRLGMHGHQHRSDALPVYLYNSDRQTMAVVSAGSLCAEPERLPRGSSCQYNIVEISDNYLSARVHVREMLTQGVFGPGRLLGLGAGSHAKVQWTPVPTSPVVNIGRGGGMVNAAVEQIEDSISTGQYNDAIARIDVTGGILGNYGRRLLSEALFKANNWKRLVVHLGNPRNSEELVKLVVAAIALRDWRKADQALDKAESSGEFPAAILRDLRSRLVAEKRIR